MSGTPQFPELNIGKAAADEYFRPPRLPSLFAARAARLRKLSADHPLSDFLHFIALIADQQARLAATEISRPALSSPEAMKTAAEHGMPMLDLSSWRPPESYRAGVRGIAAALADAALPEESLATARRLAQASDDDIDTLGLAIVTRTVPPDASGDAVFAVAALQVEFASHAARLDASMIRPLEAAGLCPACGSPPVAGVVVADEAYGRRYLTCSLCCSSWNHVRVNCIVCGDEKKIAYHEIEGGNGVAKAEVCDACGSYSKLLQQAKDMGVEPFADDLASLGLDMLVSEAGWTRHAPNPFLQGQ